LALFMLVVIMLFAFYANQILSHRVESDKTRN